MRRVLTVFLFLLMTGFSAMSQSEAEEDNLKAAFIYKFTKYIEWNAASGEKEFVIGVIGDSPIYDALEQIAATNRVNDMRISVRRFNNADEISFCHILFIARHNTISLRSILTQISKGTLTISEQDGFAKQGTALNFVVTGSSLKFEANMKSINSAGLKISSQLLKLAILVAQD